MQILGPYPASQILSQSPPGLGSQGILLVQLPESAFDSGYPLSGQDRQDAQRQVRERDAQALLWRRALIRRILAQLLSQDPQKVHISFNSHGKPRAQGCSFNYSWTGSSMAIIFSCRGDSTGRSQAQGLELGIDLEPKSRFLSALGDRKRFSRLEKVALEFSTGTELAWLAQCRQGGGEEAWLHAFGRLWTRKEAVVKAWGESIGSHALKLSLEGERHHGSTFHWKKRAWALYDVDQEVHFLSWCSSRDH